jgi:uncharacterized protein YndB with AHSA1/START domain
MLVTILIVVAIVVVAVIAFIASRPGEFQVTRSATIAAPPAVVFAQVNDFHNWQPWSPWARMDPNAKNTFEGAPSGVGAVFHWEGKKVGQGRMTLLESQPDERIRIQLDFLKPFKASNSAEFTFEPNRDGTLVTWTMVGKSNFVMKAVGLFVNCDKMCGDQFEQGLQNLNAVCQEEVAVRG